jgi:hypothetical protein
MDRTDKILIKNNSYSKKEEEMAKIIEILPVCSMDELGALHVLLHDMNGASIFRRENELLCRLRDYIKLLHETKREKKQIPNVENILLEMGYSIEVVCSLNDEKCRNRSCLHYNEKWQDNCGDKLNCQQCPRSRLK